MSSSRSRPQTCTTRTSRSKEREMYVEDMLVTLDKVTANNGKAQLVLSIDVNSIDKLSRLVGMTGQLMVCDLRTSQEKLPIEDE